MTALDAMKAALDALGLRLSWYVIRRKKEPQTMVDAYNAMAEMVRLLEAGSEIHLTSTTTCDQV